MGQSGSFGGSEIIETGGSGGYAGIPSTDNIIENTRPEKLQQPPAQNTQVGGGYAGYGNSQENKVSEEGADLALQKPQGSLISNDINERNSNLVGE